LESQNNWDNPESRNDLKAKTTGMLERPESWNDQYDRNVRHMNMYIGGTLPVITNRRKNANLKNKYLDFADFFCACSSITLGTRWIVSQCIGALSWNV
jgi:hypothetical protein